MTVCKHVKGYKVEARPIFKGGPLPHYWEGTINGRTVSRKFFGPSDIFRYVEVAHKTVLPLMR